ncbi:fluoride efflux transporter CrcB [Staphylococcus aureus]|uniref:fluoride efflux transporter CrcB n=1 Tax=Staphylococcus aureus TaxID=1280 RepID=UPI0038969CAB
MYIFLSVVLLGAFITLPHFFLNTDGGFPIGNTDSQFDWCLCNGIANSLNNCIFFKPSDPKKAITTGFLGALTTFSTFQLELIHMFDHQQFITLLLYTVSSYVFGILLCYVGIKLGGGLS